MPSQSHIELERVYEEDHHGGYRVLVDRLWPRGVKKTDLKYDEWLKDVAPSDALRRWYGHEPDRYGEFAHRYRAELKAAPAIDGLARLRRLAIHRRLVLLTATKDVEHSGAEVLRKVLTRARG